MRKLLKHPYVNEQWLRGADTNLNIKRFDCNDIASLYDTSNV